MRSRAGHPARQRARLAAGALAAMLVGVVTACSDSGSSDNGSNLSPTSSTVADSGATERAVEPAAAIEPDIQIASDPAACRSTSLVGQSISTASYLLLTQAENTASVDWSIDGRPLGRSWTPPFVPEDDAGEAVALPLDLAPGSHEVAATVSDANGETAPIFARFTVPSSDAGVSAPAAIEVVTADGPRPLVDWEILAGTVTIRAPSSVGALELDGVELDQTSPLSIDSLPAGRHEIVGSGPFAAPLTFVSTGGRPAPPECGAVEVRDYGAAGDGVTDDTGAFSAAIDVAMAAGADLHLAAGTYAVPQLKNLSLARDVSIVGEPGATIDGGRPAEKYVMFKVDANVRLSGVAVRNGGRVFALDDLSHAIDRFVIEDSAFEQVWSPAHVSDAPDQLVRTLEIHDNRVEHAVKGFYLPLKLIEHARVSGNTVTDVGDAAIRIGSDVDASMSSQRDIDVRENVVSHVVGPSDANGIKVMGVDGAIVDNEVRDIASEDGTDSEGIYTKGYGHLISDNLLVDAGRTQAQITVKSDSTTIDGNTIITESAPTNGIRIEGSDVVVTNNRISGGLADSVGITTKLTEGVGGYRLEGNFFSDTDGIAISVGGKGPIVIRGNEFNDVRGDAAVRVRATRADTSDVLIEKNWVISMTNPAGTAFVLESRAGRVLSEVKFDDNTVTDVMTGLAFDIEPDARIVGVDLRGNSFLAMRGAEVKGESDVEGLTVVEGEG